MAAPPAETQEDDEDRFEFLTEEEHDRLKEGYVPRNTEKNTKWALSNFESWRQAHVKSRLKLCPDNLLARTD